MQDKDLRKLSRAELLELLISQTRRVEELEAQLADALAQLEKRQIAIDKAGTLAEASLMLNGVLEATEKAAAQYLENIERLSGQQQRVCDAMEAAARERAKTILEEAEAACREREARCDAYEKALTQRLQKFYDQRPGLKELVQKAAAE
jgi:chemotaxis regulatin CheY-phosphate phosphatase CheZ